MGHRQAPLIAAVLAAFFSAPCLAGFAEAAPPSGWSQGTGSAGGFYNKGGGASANGPWINGSAAGNVQVNVGGKPVKLPAKMLMAANAGRYLGGWAFANPLLLVGALGLPLLVDWLQDNGFEWLDGMWKKKDPTVCTVGPCYTYTATIANVGSTTGTSRQDACSKMPAKYNETRQQTYWSGESATVNASNNCVLTLRNTDGGSTILTGPTGQTQVQPQPAQYIPATQSDMETALSPVSVPDAVANEAPVPLPVQQPILNPTPENQPATWREPVGLPQPVPNTSPPKYRQPVVDIVPAGRPGAPWVVDLQPKEVTGDDPAGQEEGAPVPGEEPAGQTTAPKDQPDFCAANPEVLACQNLDQPEDVELPTRSPSISITPDSGWGADNASCPAPRTLQSAGGTIQIPFDLFCTFMSGIRPVVIAVAWLIASLMVVGAVRGNE